MNFIFIKSILFGTLLSYFCTQFLAQENIIYKDSTISKYHYEIGLGCANVGELVVRGIDGQKLFPEKDKLSILLSQHLKENRYIRLGFVLGFYKQVVSNNSSNFINPFIVTAGIEKRIKLKRYFFSYGSDLYYFTTIKGTNVGGQYWQTFNPGFGIAGVVGCSYIIIERLSIHSETEIGFGLSQKFNNVGFTTNKVLSPTINAIKTLSFELKYHF